MSTAKIKKFILVTFILLITVLAIFFHFEIHFENALTKLPEPDFTVHISIWRYMFEPFLGPLLFFNRSLYALIELPWALFWSALLYLFFSATKELRKTRNFKKVVFRKLCDIPLVLGICFSIFVMILFLPLPNNTLVNRSQNSVLVTTHAHTEYSHDGLISQEAMWKWHRRNGFDAFFISDHANHKKSLQFSEAQRKGAFDIIPLVMVGQEYSGTNHMSLLGLNGRFETKGMADKAVIDSVHAYGGAVIINHWFDGKGKKKEFYRDLGADGFEIENVGSDLYYDRDIFEELKSFCKTNNLTMVGGLDFHGYGRVCSIYNALEISNWHTMSPIEKERTILDIFRKGQQEKIKVLLYKDRDFYSDSNIAFRPFMTSVNYFRTLNILQLLSWVFWIALILFGKRLIRKKSIVSDKIILGIAGCCVVFLLVMSMIYYFKGGAVKGYNKVYSEYFGILGTVGLILAIFVAILIYVRIGGTSLSNQKNKREKFEN